MRARSRYHVGVLALAALSLAGCMALLLAPSVPAGAAPPTPHLRAQSARSAGRPSLAVATASPAVVRVLSYYYGITRSGLPYAAPVACVGTGVLVGTTGPNASPNSFNYVLTATSLINPLVPCEGAQAAFQSVNGPSQSWELARVEIWLGEAYTGSDAKQLGAVRYAIDPSQIATTGQAFAPKLIALPLTGLSSAPNHDLPVLQTPQPSDPPAGPNQTVLDLGSLDGQFLGRDELAANEIAGQLYPLSVDAAAFSQEVVPSPTKPPPPTPPQQTVIGGTAVPTTAPTATATLPATPTPLSAQIGVGAPVVNSNGALVGMVIADASGAHIITPLARITQAIGPVSGKPGPVMTHWHQGLAAFYSTPPDFTTATTTFTALTSTAPDFGGAAPYLAAARAHTTNVNLPGATPTAVPTATPQTGHGGGLSFPLFLVATGVALFVVLLGAILLVFRILQTVSRRKRDPLLDGPSGARPATARTRLPRRAKEAPTAPTEVDETPTQPQLTTSYPEPPPIVVGGAPDGANAQVENAPTMPKLPVVSRPVSPLARGVGLTAQAAGLTDVGRRRASEPNQDNILALTGTYLADGRPQSYGLFLVADGMGGHTNGKEASRRAIEVIAEYVVSGLNGSQPLSPDALAGLLREGAMRANADLRERNTATHADMGTTLTAALVVGDVAYVGNVGDSRTYLFSPDSGLRQITTDHSVVASLVSAGVIRPEDVYTHPRRNQIYRSLGGQHEDAEIDISPVELQPGDRLLLCSDGLWEMVRDSQLESILRATAEPRQAVELLVQEANANGGEDNISVIVVRMLEQPVLSQARPGVQVVVGPQESVWPGQA